MESINALDRVVSDDPAILKFCETMKQFPIKFVDQSVKFGKGSINKERVLCYIPSTKVSFARLWDLLLSFGIPQSVMFECQQHYYESFNLGIALERNGDKNNYRIYTESRITQKKYKELIDKLVFKYRNVWSAKWNDGITDPEDIKRTTYESILEPTYSRLKFAMSMARVSYVPSAITKTLKSKGPEDYTGTYFVTDDNTNRSALDIKFDLDEEFHLNDFANDLTKFSSKNVEVSLMHFNSFPIHHVSLGIDGNENDYVTLYFKL
jgi:hypothetical protein